MNETRRTEIKEHTETLLDIRRQLNQIRIADSVSKHEPDTMIEKALDAVDDAVTALKRSLA